jgi:hypothetical protein
MIRVGIRFDSQGVEVGAERTEGECIKLPVQRHVCGVGWEGSAPGREDLLPGTIRGDLKLLTRQERISGQTPGRSVNLGFPRIGSSIEARCGLRAPRIEGDLGIRHLEDVVSRAAGEGNLLIGEEDLVGRGTTIHFETASKPDEGALWDCVEIFEGADWGCAVTLPKGKVGGGAKEDC